MHIRKAVITAASPSQHALPLQRLVDGDGNDKSALQLIVDEISSAGIEEICIVVRPGDQEAFKAVIGPHGNQVQYVEQTEPLGYGDAVYRAAGFVGNDSFLHLVEDHLYLSHTDRSCAKQLIDAASENRCAVSAVQPTRETKLRLFGVIGGSRLSVQSDLYEVRCVKEKPTPTQAEQDLVIAGLRAGFYQCFLGMHVLTPQVMEILGHLLESKSTNTVTLSDALNLLAEREQYLAFELQGKRYNIGVKYGLLTAQLAISLSGNDRDQILTELVELLALRQQRTNQ